MSELKSVAPEELLADRALQVETLIQARKIRDWIGNGNVQNDMMNAIEDYLYDESHRIFSERLDDCYPRVERLGVNYPFSVYRF